MRREIKGRDSGWVKTRVDVTVPISRYGNVTCFTPNVAGGENMFWCAPTKFRHADEMLDLTDLKPVEVLPGMIVRKMLVMVKVRDTRISPNTEVWGENSTGEVNLYPKQDIVAILPEEAPMEKPEPKPDLHALIQRVDEQEAEIRTLKEKLRDAGM